MTATATQQVLNNGPRNLVLKYTISGLTGDASAATLVDISSLDSSVRSGGLRLDRAEWSLTGFSCALEWESGATNTDLLEMASSPGRVDLRKCGGITNNATLPTGDVVFTTTGYTASGEGGNFTLWFRKKGVSSDTALQDESAPSSASLTFASTAPTVTSS